MISSRLVRAVGLVMIASSALLLVSAAIRGDLEFNLIFIIPVMVGSGLIPVLGGLLLFFGIVLIFLSYMVGHDAPREGIRVRDEHLEEKPQRKRFGGVVLIRPLPIVFGSDRGLALWMLVIAAICLMAISLLILLWL